MSVPSLRGSVRVVRADVSRWRGARAGHAIARRLLPGEPLGREVEWVMIAQDRLDDIRSQEAQPQDAREVRSPGAGFSGEPGDRLSVPRMTIALKR